MAETGLTPNMQSWTNDLNSIGRVEIKSSFNSLWWRVGLAVAILMAVIYFRYQAGDIGTRGLTLAIIGSVVLVVGCVAFVFWRYGNKTLLIERDGVTLLDGNFYPWSDISSVSVWRDPRGQAASALQFNLTESAWKNHMDKQNAGGAMMHKANTLIAGDRALVISAYIGANPAELAAWMNQFPQGEIQEV